MRVRAHDSKKLENVEGVEGMRISQKVIDYF